MGTIIDQPADFYSNRLTKREKKKDIVEALIGDNETRKYYKRKYNEIQGVKQKYSKAAYKTRVQKTLPPWKISANDKFSKKNRK